MDTALTNIGELMRENGYYRSTITPQESEDAATQRISIRFEMIPGEQARVGKVTVNCDSGCAPADVAKIAKLRPGDRVSPQRTRRALQRVRKRYQKQNRLLSQVSVVEEVLPPGSQCRGLTHSDIVPGPAGGCFRGRVQDSPQRFETERSGIRGECSRRRPAKRRPPQSAELSARPGIF